jgi:proteasome alpha subunit
MDLDEGVDLALAALASVNEDGLTPEGIGVATVDVETETFGQLTDEEKETHLAEADLLDTGEDADDEDSEEE